MLLVCRRGKKDVPNNYAVGWSLCSCLSLLPFRFIGLMVVVVYIHSCIRRQKSWRELRMALKQHTKRLYNRSRANFRFTSHFHLPKKISATTTTMASTLKKQKKNTRFQELHKMIHFKIMSQFVINFFSLACPLLLN